MIVCEAPLFLRKIAIRYIDIVAGLAITRYHDEKTIYVARSWNHPSSWNMFIVMCRDGNIVAVDSVTPTLFVISEGGDLLRWFVFILVLVNVLQFLFSHSASRSGLTVPIT